ncbi:unnamed protein product [Rhodiola kirilowii]
MVRAILIRCRSFCSSSSQYSSASAANQTNPRGKLSSLFQPESVVDVNEAISFFDAMISSQRPSSIRQRNKLLAIVIQNRRYYDATQMYRKLEVIQSNINTINMLVNCYSKVSCIDYGFGMLGLILKRGLSPDVNFFNTLVKGLCLEKRVEEAGWILCKMEEIGCSPDEVMWRTFYGGLCSLGDLDLAVHLCDKLAGKLYADSAIVMHLISVCHAVAIHYLIEKGLVVKAEQLMVEMRRQGILPYLFAYHLFIYFWCCAQEMEKAINMLSDMKYYGIYPNAVTYNMIIHGFCRAGQIEEALCMVHEMKNSALSPNVITYNCLINGFCRASELKEAWHMFTEMKTRGPVPNVVTYNCLIHGLCRTGELEEAWHMFNEMKTRGPDPDVVTYNCFIHGLCRAGELEEAWHMFTEMKTCGPDPNVVTYTCLIHGLCRAGELEEACHMFTGMKTRGPDPNVVTYNCLIDGLCRAGKFKEAWHMFTEMKTRGPDPNVVTYNCLIHGLCCVGQFKEAWHMFTGIKTRGPDPDVVTYNCLIHGLFRVGQFEAAWNMFTEMKTRGPCPNVVTYTSIINEFCRAGRVGRAQHLFHEMKADGVSPNEYTYTSIIGGLCKVGDGKAANQIFTQMLEQGVKPNYITLDAVRNARLKESNRNVETQILYLESAIEDQIVTATEHSRRSSTRDRMNGRTLIVKRGCDPDVIFSPHWLKGCVWRRGWRRLGGFCIGWRRLGTVLMRSCDRHFMEDCVLWGIGIWPFICAIIWLGSVVKAEQLMVEMRRQGIVPYFTEICTVLELSISIPRLDDSNNPGMLISLPALHITPHVLELSVLQKSRGIKGIAKSVSSVKTSPSKESAKLQGRNKSKLPPKVPTSRGPQAPHVSELNCAPVKVLDQVAHVQVGKPTGLRMPSPSLGFFGWPKQSAPVGDTHGMRLTDSKKKRRRKKRLLKMRMSRG